MRYRFAVIASCLSLCSCVITTMNAEGRAQLSSGHVGCLPEEITTTEPTSKSIYAKNWIATCRGKEFVCASNESTMRVDCAPRVP